MVKIGITGGIGSGKSVVASLLSLYGIPVYIADTESKRLTDSSPLIRQELVRLFGAQLYTDRGLDRRLLASCIFGKPEMLRQVNGIIHPVVDRDFREWADRQNGAACGIESAILFESGFDRLVDIRLMVYAPLDVRIRRAVRRDSSGEVEIRRRVSSQLPDEEKRERADFVIVNDGKRALIPQMEKFLAFFDLDIPKLY